MKLKTLKPIEMKLQFKTLIVLLILPALMVANHDKFKGKYTKEKTVKKEFSVNRDAVLKVSNSYGNVDVVTWNENRTVIEVRIKTNSDSEEKAQKKLDEITIEFSGTASLVTAKTLFGNKKDSWSFWGDGHKNVSMEINYTIKLPRTNSVDLNNDYGAISLDKLEGTANINCDYGQLLIGELMADNNVLRFDYTSKSTIAYMKSGKINADYSSFTLEKGGNIDLSADYTQSEFKDIQDITFNCDYGKVEIEKARNISGRGDYLTQRIGSVNGSLSLNSDYGSIKVDRLTGSAKSVTIDGDYTGIKLGFARDYSFSFNVDLTYCSLGGEETVTVTNKSVENSRKTYAGYRGSNNSGNLIKINSDYGGVTFFEN
jgi:hypothetical protein